MTVRQKREALKRANPDPKWIEKVDNMSDQEIRDVYSRLKSQDKV